MARTSMLPARPIRSPRTHGLMGGNGSPEPTDRLSRIEALLEDIEERLNVQLQRIADLQVQLDRAIAERPIKVTR